MDHWWPAADVGDRRRQQRVVISLVAKMGWLLAERTETQEIEQGLFWGHLLWASVPRLVAGGGACRSVACCATGSRKLAGRRLPGQMERRREEGEAG